VCRCGRLLTPDLGYVDFAALKSKGFNAVVIDKDNCVVRRWCNSGLAHGRLFPNVTKCIRLFKYAHQLFYIHH